jgi:hypothetical protein
MNYSILAEYTALDAMGFALVARIPISKLSITFLRQDLNRLKLSNLTFIDAENRILRGLFTDLQ